MFSQDRETDKLHDLQLADKLMNKTDCLNNFSHAQIEYDYCIFISLHRKKACIGKIKCYTVTKLAMHTKMCMYYA